MHKILYSVLIFLFSFSLVHAQEAQDITFGEYTVSYDEVVETEGKSSYQSGGTIVLSVFDTSGNGEADLWLRYDADGLLDLEAHDTDADGEPDVFFELNAAEEVTSESGDGLVQFEKPVAINPETGEAEAPSTPTAGNDSSGGSTVFWVLLVLILLGAGFFFWKKRNK